MPAKITLIFICALLCISSRGQTFSPKLHQFLLEHPEASNSLSNAMAEALSGRTAQIYYFYTNDESVPNSHVNYIGEPSVVGIFVRENQQACDEYLCILFEALNSKGEKRFRELFAEAKFGALSKTNFVREMQRQEFQAVKETQKIVAKLKLKPKEIADSRDYKHFLETPSDLAQFLVYSKKVSQGQYQKEYETLYATIHKKPQQ